MSLDNIPPNPNANPNTPEQSQLGRASAYADKYDPTLLFPIARATQREAMGIAAGALPFFGADLWTAFEVSWLNLRGKPQLAIAHFTIPCETPNIIESKSFKLYLNSFNSTAFASIDAVRDLMRADLTEALWRGSGQSAGIGVKLLATDMFDRAGA
jgi:7-cyano-7-deazaguanine reductase